MDVYSETVAERRMLLEDLKALTAAQWDARSLCDGWRVRDVVAHLCAGCDWKVGSLMTNMARARFRLDTFLYADALRGGAEPVESISQRFSDLIDSSRRPPMTKPMDVLREVVVHRQDILLALGKSAVVDSRRMQAVLDAELNAQHRKNTSLANVRFEATDFDWSSGNGAVVSGPSANLLMSLLGRQPALAALSGDGISAFSRRLA